jgi:DNA integrity scanning protein DisA with diadenylate cyclase activity
MQESEYIPTINTLRTALDIALVFIIVYVLLKLLRGTRAVPTVVGMVILALLYWLAVAQDLATLEFVLRSAVLYIGVAIIVLFQSEIRQALIYFGNRLRFPVVRRGTLGETIYDEIVLAATTLSSEKIGALIVIERNVGLRNFIDAGVNIDAKISYDLLVTIFNPSTPLHDGAGRHPARTHRRRVGFPAADKKSERLARTRHPSSRRHRSNRRHGCRFGRRLRRNRLDYFCRRRRRQTPFGYDAASRAAFKGDGHSGNGKETRADKNDERIGNRNNDKLGVRNWVLGFRKKILSPITYHLSPIT